MNPILDLLRSLVVGVLIITVLVFVHELGHYLAARAVGMKVDAFAVMMGGIRKTDLTPHLKAPMASRWAVTTVYALALVAIGIGVTLQNVALYQTGLVFVSLVLPIWIATRIGALYHMPKTWAFQTMFTAYAGGLLLVLLSAGTRGFQSATNVLHFLFYASLVGLCMVYYAPTGRRLEEESMGHGRVKMGGEDVPVRFRPVWHCTNKEGTEFSLLLLPLGGFAQIRGMAPKADGSEATIEGGFYSRPPWARFVAIAAGPFFSIMLGVLLIFTNLVAFGLPEPSNQPVIGAVAPGGPAAVAGFQAKDRIVAVNGKAVDSFYEVVVATRASGGEELRFLLEREGVRQEIKVQAKLDERATPVLGPNLEITEEMKRQYKLGVGPSTQTRTVPVAEAAATSLRAPVMWVQTITALMSTPEGARDSVSGPAGVASAVHEATREGAPNVLHIAAMITLSLGFMNLLPIPPLDGGQMLVALVEMVRGGKRLSMQVQHTVSMVGVVFVIALTLFVISSDAGRLMGR